MGRFYRPASSGKSVHSCQQDYIIEERLQSSMTRSTMEEETLMIMSTMSTAMTHHKTSGPLYNHFPSDGLVWVMSMAS